MVTSSARKAAGSSPVPAMIASSQVVHSSLLDPQSDLLRYHVSAVVFCGLNGYVS